MTTTKLRIDLDQGIIEVEGEDSFVKTVYEDFKERLLSDIPIEQKTRTGTKANGKTKSTPETKLKTVNASKKKKPSKGSASGSIAKDLDLSGGGKVQSLKDFFGQYKVSSNFERNLIFVYYLQHKLKIKGITLDHIFTCYRDVGVKVPAALQQSLWDTTNRKGWLDTSSSENIRVTVPGMNFIEHDMSKSGTE